VSPARQYQVHLKASAEKELDRLPAQAAKRVIKALLSLESLPRRRGCKKLQATDPIACESATTASSISLTARLGLSRSWRWPTARTRTGKTRTASYEVRLLARGTLRSVSAHYSETASPPAH